MIRPFCGAPPPETKKKIRSLILRLGLRKKDGNVNKNWFGDVQAGSCPHVIPSIWDKQWSFGVPGQLGAVNRAARRQTRAANRRPGRRLGRRRCVVPKKIIQETQEQRVSGRDAGPSFTSCRFARGHATSMVPSFFPPRVVYALTRTTNSPFVHPTTQCLCAQQ